MSPITKTVKLPDVRVSEKLKAETVKAAEIEQENISEYIRKAVEMRNKKVLKGISVRVKEEKECQKKIQD
jgi:hypothetical protein